MLAINCKPKREINFNLKIHICFKSPPTYSSYKMPPLAFNTKPFTPLSYYVHSLASLQAKLDPSSLLRYTGTHCALFFLIRNFYGHLLSNSLSQNRQHPLAKIGRNMSDKKGSTSNHGLNLNIPPPRVANQIPDSPTRLPIAPPTSPTSSCVSSELSQDDNSSSSSRKNNNRGCTRSPEDISMVLVGCSRCLMYMMVNEGEPKCPKCKSTTLIHFLNYNNIP